MDACKVSEFFFFGPLSIHSCFGLHILCVRIYSPVQNSHATRFGRVNRPIDLKYCVLGSER